MILPSNEGVCCLDSYIYRIKWESHSEIVSKFSIVLLLYSHVVTARSFPIVSQLYAYIVTICTFTTDGSAWVAALTDELTCRADAA